MYTDANINPTNNEEIRSAKRIYLKHKEKTTTIKGFNENITSKSDTVVSNIYYTNVPLDGINNADVETAHTISINVAASLFAEISTSNIEIETKVREKDQVIVSTITYNMNHKENAEIKALEKEVWYPLKMETLKHLCVHPEIGEYIPLTDGQVQQLTDYMTIA